MNELLRSIVTKAGTLSRGLRGEKLREAVTSGDQLTQSPICPCSGPGPRHRQAVTGDQYNTVQTLQPGTTWGMFVNSNVL